MTTQHRVINPNKIEQEWIKLCVWSLAAGGLYSIFIVLLRMPSGMPGIPVMLGGKDMMQTIFQTALIIHVDYTVLFWLLSFGLMVMTKSIAQVYDSMEYSIIRQVQTLILLSIILIFISPALSTSKAFMNNYIPIIHSLYFILGLGLFFASCFALSSIALISANNIAKPMGLLGLIICTSFGISAYKLSLLGVSQAAQLDQHDYYELLFWGGGHLMQFFYISGMIYVWYNYKPESERVMPLSYLLWFNTALTIPIIFIQAGLEITDPNYYYLFTEHMKIFGALGFIICLIGAGYDVFIGRSAKLGGVKDPRDIESHKNYALILSLILFASGGVFALRITDVNAVIPAHYHGSIVGITIIFMSYIYVRINEIFTPVNFRAATNQLILYSVGQFIHIFGLFMSGGYGALRKSPGQELTLQAKVWMGLMGFGGLLAIAAGLIFVYICVRTIIKFKES